MIDSRRCATSSSIPRANRAASAAAQRGRDFERATAAHGLATTGGVGLEDRHRRPHARRRARLADAELRPGLRQPDRRGRRDRGRTGRARERERESDLLLGAARRRRKLRRRHDVRVPAASGVDGVRRNSDLSARRSARDVLPSIATSRRTAPDTLTVFAAMMHSPEGAPVCALSMCYNGTAEEGEKAIKAIREFELSRSPAKSGRCRTRRCSACSTTESRRASTCTGGRSSSRRSR